MWYLPLSKSWYPFESENWNVNTWLDPLVFCGDTLVVRVGGGGGGG